MNDILRDIFLAFVRVHLLHHAAEGPIYGLEMIEELGRHGYDIGPGTLYPIFHSLEAAGYLACERRAVNGKVRKYYRITEDGRDLLAHLRPKIRELVGEVLEGGGNGPDRVDAVDDNDEKIKHALPAEDGPLAGAARVDRRRLLQ
jgi:DNA-binding PadR family transcriptional regulator